MFVAHPGEIVGGLAVLTGEPSFFSIRAKHASRIAMLSKTTFYKYVNILPYFYSCITILRGNLYTSMLKIMTF